MIAAIHRHGSRTFAQLLHAGRQTTSQTTGASGPRRRRRFPVPCGGPAGAPRDPLRAPCLSRWPIHPGGLASRPRTGGARRGLSKGRTASPRPQAWPVWGKDSGNIGVKRTRKRRRGEGESSFAPPFVPHAENPDRAVPMEKEKRKESLNKAASAPQGASQSLMRPESRESERPLFRASERKRARRN